MKTDLPSQITDRLQAILRRVRRLQVSRGLLGLLTTFLAGVLIVMAVDFFFAPVLTSVRLGFFVALLLATLAAFWILLWKPLRRKIGLLQIARWLEVRHPEMQERISTAMELAGTSGSGTSESLLNELIAEAEIDVQELDPQIEVRARKVKAWLWPTAGILAVFLLLFIIWPAQTGRLLVRAVAPFSQTGNAGAIAFDIQPGDIEVLEDDPVEIIVLYKGSSDDTLTLETTHENGEVTEERLDFTDKEDGQHVAIYQLPSASQSFRYRVKAGRGESDGYKVTVWPKPRMTELSAVYDFPEYTGLARAKFKIAEQGVQAVIGTKIRIEGIASTPVESARFLLDDQEICSSNIDASTLNIDFPLSKEQAGTGKIILTHRLGHEVEVASFPVKALPDEAPKVSILTPTKRELKVRPDEQLDIAYQVIEKIGLQSVELDLQVNGHSVPPISQVLPTRIKNSKQALWQGNSRIYIGGIIERHPKAREVKIKLRVKDNRPTELAGPGIGESETIILKISRNAESLVRQELRAQESDIREATEKAKREIREAITRMRQHKNKVVKGELDKNDEKGLEKARKQLANVEKDLKELATRMKNSVHAPKAEQVKKAAEKTKQARESVETAPLNNTPEARKKAMENARKAAEKAVEALEKFQQQVAKDREKVEDIARLNELAQKENELARKAEAQAKEQKKPDNQWKNEQRQVQEKLRREVSERPEAKAEAAQQQAEKARELAKEARKLGEQQKELAEQGKKNKPQADAAKELAKDIEAIPDLEGRSSEKNEALNKAKQADDHAREAAKQMGEGKQEAAAQRNEAAAEALNKAAEALEAEAKRLDAQAEEAAQQAQGEPGKQAEQKQAHADGKQLADALQKAADAAQAENSADAAKSAKEAADAIEQLAQQAMQNMKSGQKPGQPKPGEKPSDQMADKPGEKSDDKPQEGDPKAQPDQGVPPELAKLGVSASDWEKLKVMMKSDVGGAGASGVPEDYRGLVRKYFQEVAREGKEEN